MSSNTNTKVPTPSNPSALKPRYEIRKLESEHIPWATAIMCHSNLCHSPVWPVLYPNNITTRLLDCFDVADYLTRHQVESGLSFGVFDNEYKYKRPESEAVGGKLWWDRSEAGSENFEAEAKRFLDQMDFPLVSIVLAYDAFDPLNFEKMGPMIAQLPHFGLIYHILMEGDKRDKSTWEPTAHGQVLFRNATATKRDYEGDGIMAAAARWLMREIDAKGFRGIQIECLHDAVTHVWSKPPSPFKGQIVTEFHTGTWVDEKGEKPFLPAQQRATKVYVDLKPKA